MTIERLHFEDGHRIPPGKLADTEVTDVLEKHGDEFKVLPEGEYDLTPKLDTNNSINYDLKVLKSGNGIFIETWQGDNQFESKDKVTFLPRNKSLVIVFASSDEKKEAIYDIIRHVPELDLRVGSGTRTKQSVPAGVI